MRKIFILLFVISTSVGAQTKKQEARIREINNICDSIRNLYTETDDGIILTRIVNTPNLVNKDMLFNACIEALTSTYVDAKDVIQNKDKENGIIFGKGVFSNNLFRTRGIVKGSLIGYMKCYHKIKMEIRDGRVRISVFINDISTDRLSNVETHHNIKEYYPFYKDCDAKHIEDSFIFVYNCINSSCSILDNIEKELLKYKQSDIW